MHKALIDLAIIIPTLNEEHFIGFLLDSIIDQSIQPKKIVIVDAYSQDKTLFEVKKRQKKLPQIKIFQIERFTISRQRNFGVKQTFAKHLLFLDADTELKGKDTLKIYLEQVRREKCDIAMAPNVPTTNYWKDIIFYKVMDLTFRIFTPVWPMATSINMYFKRDIFEKIGGFDENVAVGEDFEIVQRAVKQGVKFSILSYPKIYTTPRRIEKEGRIKFTLKNIISFFRVVFKGYENNPIKYEFGHFTKGDQPRKR